MKNILVPTDFSENCNKAAELGITMARLFDAEIHFFHLLKTPVDWVKLDKQKEKRYPETLKKIVAIMTMISLLRAVVAPRVWYGNFWEVTSNVW